MLLLTAYSIVEGDLPSALRFLLKIDPHRITPRAALEALGLGFFSIGVGLGLMASVPSRSKLDCARIVLRLLRALGMCMAAGNRSKPVQTVDPGRPRRLA